MSSQGYQSIPETLTDKDETSVAAKEHRRKIARAVNGMLQGKVNCTLDVVVTASQTSTIITDPRLTIFSFLSTMAFDANGKADEVAGIYFDTFASGVGGAAASITMHHRSDASVRSLRILILG